MKWAWGRRNGRESPSKASDERPLLSSDSDEAKGKQTEHREEQTYVFSEHPSNMVEAEGGARELRSDVVLGAPFIVAVFVTVCIVVLLVAVIQVGVTHEAQEARDRMRPWRRRGGVARGHGISAERAPSVAKQENNVDRQAKDEAASVTSEVPLKISPKIKLEKSRPSKMTSKMTSKKTLPGRKGILPESRPSQMTPQKTLTETQLNPKPPVFVERLLNATKAEARNSSTQTKAWDEARSGSKKQWRSDFKNEPIKPTEARKFTERKPNSSDMSQSQGRSSSPTSKPNLDLWSDSDDSDDGDSHSGDGPKNDDGVSDGDSDDDVAQSGSVKDGGGDGSDDGANHGGDDDEEEGVNSNRDEQVRFTIRQTLTFPRVF
jgi:hypothetical protein